MNINRLSLPFLLLALLFLAFCKPPKKAGTAQKPPSKTKPSDKPKHEPMDTVRWTNPANPAPPIGGGQNPGGQNGGNAGGDFSKQKFRVAMLLPFLTHQADSANGGVPEKSRLAVQFYGGAKIALEELSSEDGMNLTVDVFDTKINDAEFEKLLKNPKLDLADVFIGPIRSSHLTALSKKTKLNRKIVLSPESPNMDLTSGNPNFIQLNPSLKAHCEAITKFVNKKHQPSEVTLVCKQKESERLAYFQNANSGGEKFRELIMPDAAENFEKTDLKPYFKAGKTAVFVLPSWTSQDFVFAFFRKVKASAGKNRVEIYGMPQWLNFENIEPEYFQNLNVHVSSASFVDLASPEVEAFREKFYAAYGTIPDDDAFNGYDATLFLGKALKKYGLDFPGKVGKEQFVGLHGNVRLGKYFAEPGRDDRFDNADYLENRFVHILKFQNFKFSPAE